MFCLNDVGILVWLCTGKKSKKAAKEAKEEPKKQTQASEKKDFATAILDKKKSTRSLLVDDADNEDHSIVAMSSEKMEELGIFQVPTCNRQSLICYVSIIIDK